MPHDNQDVIDWLSIAAVQRILAGAGVDMAVLIEADPAACACADGAAGYESLVR